MHFGEREEKRPFSHWILSVFEGFVGGCRETSKNDPFSPFLAFHDGQTTTPSKTIKTTSLPNDLLGFARPGHEPPHNNNLDRREA